MKVLKWLAPLAVLLALGGPALAAPGGGVPPINFFDISYSDKDVHGEKLEQHASPMAPPLILALINFGLFFGLLVWKGGPPIRRFVRQRHLSIKEALEEGQRLRDDAQHKLEEYGRRISGLDAEVNELIAMIRADAESERKRIIAEAEAQAEAMKRDADNRITAEIQRARQELEREVIAVAVAAAEQIIRKQATPADHQQLVDGFIRDVAATEGSTVDGQR